MLKQENTNKLSVIEKFIAYMDSSSGNGDITRLYDIAQGIAHEQAKNIKGLPKNLYYKYIEQQTWALLDMYYGLGANLRRVNDYREMDSQEYRNEYGQVIWRTEGDRVCDSCEELDGKVFYLANIPVEEMHPNCGCYVEEYLAENMGSVISDVAIDLPRKIQDIIINSNQPIVDFSEISDFATIVPISEDVYTGVGAYAKLGLMAFKLGVDVGAVLGIIKKVIASSTVGPGGTILSVAMQIPLFFAATSESIQDLYCLVAAAYYTIAEGGFKSISYSLKGLKEAGWAYTFDAISSTKINFSK